MTDCQALGQLLERMRFRLVWGGSSLRGAWHPDRGPSGLVLRGWARTRLVSRVQVRRLPSLHSQDPWWSRKVQVDRSVLQRGPEALLVEHVIRLGPCQGLSAQWPYGVSILVGTHPARLAISGTSLGERAKVSCI